MPIALSRAFSGPSSFYTSSKTGSGPLSRTQSPKIGKRSTFSQTNLLFCDFLSSLFNPYCSHILLFLRVQYLLNFCPILNHPFVLRAQSWKPETKTQLSSEIFPQTARFWRAPSTSQFPLLPKHPSVLCVSENWGKVSHPSICTVPLLSVSPWVAS